MPAAGYAKTATLTIPAGSVASDQINFKLPVLITADAVLAATARADGFDILPTLLDGTVLDFERQRYNPATGELLLFVNLPAFLSATDTVIEINIGNAAAPDQQNSALTYADSTIVMHGDGVTLHDSSPAATDGVMSAGAIAAPATPSPLGTGVNLDGSQGIGFDGARFIPTLYTASFWYMDVTAAGTFINMTGPTLGNEDILRFEDKGGWSGKTDWGASFAGIANTLAGAHRIAISYNDATGDLTLYQDGVQEIVANGAPIPAGTQAAFAYFGMRAGDSKWTAMDIAEIRVTDYETSIDLEAAYFAAESNPSAFYSLSAWVDNSTAVSHSLSDGVQTGSLSTVAASVGTAHALSGAGLLGALSLTTALAGSTHVLSGAAQAGVLAINSATVTTSSALSSANSRGLLAANSGTIGSQHRLSSGSATGSLALTASSIGTQHVLLAATTQGSATLTAAVVGTQQSLSSALNIGALSRLDGQQTPSHALSAVAARGSLAQLSATLSTSMRLSDGVQRGGVSLTAATIGSQHRLSSAITQGALSLLDGVQLPTHALTDADSIGAVSLIITPISSQHRLSSALSVGIISITHGSMNPAPEGAGIAQHQPTRYGLKHQVDHLTVTHQQTHYEAQHG